MSNSARRRVLTGMDELVRDLIAMGKIDPKQVKSVVRAAGQKIVNDAKAKAPSGSVRNSIGFIEKKETQFPTSVLIGPHYPEGNLAHIFEYGTAPRFAKGGKRRGQINARPFMRPAFDANKSNAQTAIVKGLTAIIDKQAKQNNLK